MTNGVNNLQPGLSGIASGVGKSAGPASAGGSNFSDTFKQYLDEVNQLQSEASQAVQGMVTGQNDDLTGVMAAMEKSDLAFKTLMSIRTKLLDAYEELRNMPI
jgi:flagellar hook-basal body complex protein FliE